MLLRQKSQANPILMRIFSTSKYEPIIGKAEKIVDYFNRQPPIEQNEINFFCRMRFYLKKIKELHPEYHKLDPTVRDRYIQNLHKLLIQIPIEKFNAAEKKEFNDLFRDIAHINDKKLEIILTHSRAEKFELSISHEKIEQALKIYQEKFTSLRSAISKFLTENNSIFESYKNILQERDQYEIYMDYLIAYLAYFERQPGIQTVMQIEFAKQQPLPSPESKLKEDTQLIKEFSELFSETNKTNWSQAFWSTQADTIIEKINSILKSELPNKLQRIKAILENSGELIKIRVKLQRDENETFKKEDCNHDDLTRRQKIFTRMMMSLQQFDQQSHPKLSPR